MIRRKLDAEALPPLGPAGVQDLPLEVVPDWEDQVHRASSVCRLIDRHLVFACRGRLWEGEHFHRHQLSPEERVQMITDSWAALCRTR